MWPAPRSHALALAGSLGLSANSVLMYGGGEIRAAVIANWHTFASLLIDSGANPKVIQEVMGHSKIQTTFDVYGHLLPGSRDEVRTRMDAYLSDQQ